MWNIWTIQSQRNVAIPLLVVHRYPHTQRGRLGDKGRLVSANLYTEIINQYSYFVCLCKKSLTLYIPIQSLRECLRGACHLILKDSPKWNLCVPSELGKIAILYLEASKDDRSLATRLQKETIVRAHVRRYNNQWIWPTYVITNFSRDCCSRTLVSKMTSENLGRAVSHRKLLPNGVHRSTQQNTHISTRTPRRHPQFLQTPYQKCP